MATWISAGESCLGHLGLFHLSLRKACYAILREFVLLLEQLPLKISFLVLKSSAPEFSADDKSLLPTIQWASHNGACHHQVSLDYV